MNQCSQPLLCGTWSGLTRTQVSFACNAREMRGMCSQSDIDLATCHIGPTRSTIQDPMFTRPGPYLPEESKLS